MLLALTVASMMQLAPADTAQDRWRIEGDVQGFPIRMTCAVDVADTVLTGSCTSDDGGTMEIRGSVEGERVTFSHDGEYEGQPLTALYTGTAQSETEVRGTIDVQPFAATGTFVARQLPAGEASAP